MSLYAVFEEAAKGKLPPQDGRVEVCRADAGKAAGAVVAFPAHFYVVAPVEPEWVHGMLPAGDYTAPLGARFLTALADWLGVGGGLRGRAAGGYAPVGGEVLLPRQP